ncbi:erythroblast NAD(P)(+)--arginine ADP-ribosyltransferase-like isoform X1 [Catharus ustulatus]|uniref:erythroblast NAD(P)(+)--arginine ADP-ribosyltransferase-like isoform X1 n=1 Tax=Catharus ustulatus TaxID=91951 RepID=UPI00140BEE2B|nr:erythroblast NAD(P)(+)--arginine ADP-ribosyltransferase-like isoform X1 [Catharus ustulatus]
MTLLVLTLALLAMTMTTEGIATKPLDMTPDSFDDQYQGCGPAMEEALPGLKRSELQMNPLFAKVWLKAVAEWMIAGSPVSPLSSPEQAIAIMASGSPHLHDYFNVNVSVVGRSPQEFRDNFHFKALHFLLSKAVATLRAAQGQKCQSVFHLADYKFYANPGDIIRFDQFTQSWGAIGDSESAATVFKVQTCHGADISTFSGAPNRLTVLIPPYEKFKVTNINDHMGKVEISLESVGTYSKHNCEWLGGGIVPRAPCHLTGLLLATTALAVATGIL